MIRLVVPLLVVPLATACAPTSAWTGVVPGTFRTPTTDTPAATPPAVPATAAPAVPAIAAPAAALPTVAALAPAVPAAAVANLEVRPDEAYAYALPWATAERLSSGYSFGAPHTGDRRRHALDIHMPTGTAVIAARDGVVAQVRQDAADGRTMPRAAAFREDGLGNHVMIRHDDGTVGVYAYLAPGGVRVSVGEAVRRGAWIAASGNTSPFSPYPRLRFEVDVPGAGGPLRSTPFRWRASPDELDAIVPVHGGQLRSHEYAAPPGATPGSLIPASASLGPEWAAPDLAAGEPERALAAVNAERAKVGAPPVVLDPLLVQAANVRSEDQCLRAYVGHADPEGRSWDVQIRLAGITVDAAGENCALNGATPEDAVGIWMGSPGHRTNMLDPTWKRMGIGVARSASNYRMWTQLFGW